MSLQGKKIKDVWQTLLNIKLSTTKSPILTGDGQELPIKVSTTDVEVNSLSINSAVASSSSQALVVDSSGKVGTRQLPFFRNASVSVVSGTNPKVNIDNGLGSPSSFTISGTDGVTSTGSGGNVVLSLSMPSLNYITSSVVLTAEDFKRVHFIDASSLAGGDIKLPTPQAGMMLRFYIDVRSTTEFNFVTNDEGSSSPQQYFYGKVEVHKTGGTSGDTQIVQRATASAAPGSYDHLKIDFDSTTTGGASGDSIELIAYDNKGWLVSAHLTTNQNVGTVAAITSA